MMMQSGVEVWDNSLVKTAQFVLNRAEPTRTGWTFLKWVSIKGRPNIAFKHSDGRTCCFIAESVAGMVADIAQNAMV